MSSKYLSIEFKGKYEKINDFFKTKGWKMEQKLISKNNVYVKLDEEEIAEEIKFFEFVDISENECLQKVSYISQNEFTNTAENGYEIIHPVEPVTSTSSTSTVRQVAEPVKQAAVEPVKQVVEQVKQVVDQFKPVEVRFPESTSQPLEKLLDSGKQTPVGAQREVAGNTDSIIAEALSDTVLPSKSPLDARDPFAYLTSKNYMSNFTVAATVLLFVFAIFD